MIRIFLAKGDRADDAEIIEGLAFVTCSNPPPAVQIATLGMKTYCRACSREGYIAPRGPRRPGTAPNGKQWALSGDINICGCMPEPVFYPARQRHMTMRFTAEEMTAWKTSAGTPAAGPATVETYDQQFRLINPRTNQPLRDMPYKIVTAVGEELAGHTDDQGFTRRVTSDHAISATLHVFEETTPLDPDWDRYL